MALHLLKLCVGPATIEELEARIARNREAALAQGQGPGQEPGQGQGHDAAPVHTTRMVPKRADEIAGQGSIYWVMRRRLTCRQAVRAIEPFVGEDGIGRCRLVLDPAVQAVVPRPCRPFQGWRYLAPADAPADLDAGTLADLAEMPETLRRELVALGLI